MQIDNFFISMNAPESPFMDGSSRFFTEAIQKAGVIEQDEKRDEYVVTELISYKCEESGSEITIIPSEKYQITTMVDFGTKILGT